MSFTASVCSFCAMTEAEGWPRLRFRATSETVVPAADSPPLIALALRFPRLALVKIEFPEPASEGERNEDGAEGGAEARMPPERGMRDASGRTGILEVVSELGIREVRRSSFVVMVPEDWTVLVMAVEGGTGCMILAEVVDGGMACLARLPIGRKIYAPLLCDGIISAI